jgi:hypothetical protein
LLFGGAASCSDRNYLNTLLAPVRQTGSDGVKSDRHLIAIDLPVDAKCLRRPAGTHLCDPQLNDTARCENPVAPFQMQVVDESFAPYRIERLKTVGESQLLLIVYTSLDLDQSHPSSSAAELVIMQRAAA